MFNQKKEIKMNYNQFCKRCKYYTSNLQTGVLCGVTNAKPNFVDSCHQFILDPNRDKKVDQELKRLENLKSEDDDFFAVEKKGIKKGALGGIIMIVIAIVWFGVGYAAGYIFYYPPILLLIGVYSLIKGIFTGNMAGKS